MPELDVTYTVEQVAERYHRIPITICRWVRAGRISAIDTGGGRYVFRKEDLDEFDRRSTVGYRGGLENGN